MNNDMPRKYTIWTEDGAGEFVTANKVIAVNDVVTFWLNGEKKKTYNKQEFMKHNPEWKLLENIE